MDWARILAYVTGTVDQELLARNEYLAAENRILKAQLKGRLMLSDADRATLFCARTANAASISRLLLAANTSTFLPTDDAALRTSAIIASATGVLGSTSTAHC
jgi:hypothetical protein